jgi:hypothetical protein
VTGPERRLETGDWVLVSGHDRASEGLGKITDAEHDPTDGAITFARVELASDAQWARWYWPGYLVRVSPADEVALAAAALGTVTLAEEQATRLRERVELARAGEWPFVRSPGLLDLLWSSVEVPGEAVNTSVVRFFEGATLPASEPEPEVGRPARDAAREVTAARPRRRGSPEHASGLRLRLGLPELERPPDLAAWLGLGESELDWFADNKGYLPRKPPGPLHHYHYEWLPKANGSRRLIEAPKEVLREIQRRILRHLLERVPAHDAAHGFRRERSVVTFTAPHAGKDLVLRMDLRNFFPSVGSARVAALFRALGYSESVAFLLMGLVTTRTPEAVLHGSGLDHPSIDALRRRHLPQGAPTSPALSNLAAFGLDVRLVAAAASFGAAYTRYADDLAFSGDRAFRRRADRLRLVVCRIASEEGFRVHWEKNRWMARSVRQRLAGLVVNARPRPSREDFDRLKATLTNCVRRGPGGENRERHADFRAHLRGRVAWFEHVDPARGARLRAAFERIVW